jgi:pyruvate/2-oxoglutarate dehydrogenase complex dihydrolipoamide dehydrogenase (E3) component
VLGRPSETTGDVLHASEGSRVVDRGILAAEASMTTDVLVIGSGQAGVPLAARLARAGRRVVLVEEKDLGGTCVNTGCTPTKTMIASARAAHVARAASRLGVRTGEVRVDLAAVVARKDAIVQQWRASVRRRIEGAGEHLTLVQGRARFVGPREVEAAGQRIAADVVVVNVGCRPAAPKIPGLDTVSWLDNASVMQLRQLPRHLLVLGGGYIGCEFAQMFRRMGSQVTVVESQDRLMAQEEPEASQSLHEVFRNEGIGLQLGAAVESVAGGNEIVLGLQGGRTVHGSHLLVAVGRRPNTDDLGCDAAGIERDERGYLPVDDHYRTNVEGVYAVGDVTPGPQFTHASWDDHRLLFEHLMGRPARKRSERIVPITAFTDPQVARVGLTVRDAKARGIECEIATMPFGEVARAIEIDERAGSMTLLVEPETEKILGASIVGAEAGELIHVFVALMQAGARARTLVDAECVHPTFAEGLQTLVMKLPRYALA